MTRHCKGPAGHVSCSSLHVMQSAEILSPTSPQNVNSRERWLSVVLGSAVATYGLPRRSIAGTIIAGLGGALVWRGASGHCAVYDALGITSIADSDGDR